MRLEVQSGGAWGSKFVPPDQRDAHVNGVNRDCSGEFRVVSGNLRALGTRRRPGDSLTQSRTHANSSTASPRPKPFLVGNTTDVEWASFCSYYLNQVISVMARHAANEKSRDDLEDGRECKTRRRLCAYDRARYVRNRLACVTSGVEGRSTDIRQDGAAAVGIIHTALKWPVPNGSGYQNACSPCDWVSSRRPPPISPSA